MYAEEDAYDWYLLYDRGEMAGRVAIGVGPNCGKNWGQGEDKTGATNDFKILSEHT